MHYTQVYQVYIMADATLLERMAQLEAWLTAVEDNNGRMENPLAAEPANGDSPDDKPKLVQRVSDAQPVHIPPNLYQAMAATYSDPQVENWKMYTFGSFCILFLQFFGIFAVVAGADKPACVSNVDCDPGSFCATRAGRATTTKACVMCLCEPPMWDEGWP